jgi:hypothetical protein
MSSIGTTQLSLAIQPTTTSFNSAVNLQCGDVPANLRCDLSNLTITPGSGTTVKLTLTAIQATAAKHGSTVLLGYSLFGALGICAVGLDRKRMKWMLATGLVLIAVMSIGCGAGGGRTSSIPAPTPATSGVKPGAYTITITGVSGSTQRSASATLIVQ